MQWIMATAILLWLYLLSVLRRGQLGFGKFMAGSIGMFFILLVGVEPYVNESMSNLIARYSAWIGHVLGITESYAGRNLVMIRSNDSAMGMLVNFECSGILEIMAFVSLLWFFPVYRKWEKAVLTMIGIIYIICANVLRVLLIGGLVYQWGNGIYYLAHSILARIFFYGLSTILYYYVFTKAQIIRQKVGKVTYETV